MCVSHSAASNPKDPPGSSVHGDSPSKNTGVGTHSFSRGSSQPRDPTQVSCIAGRFFTFWATGEAQIGRWQKQMRLFGWMEEKNFTWMLFICNPIKTVNQRGQSVRSARWQSICKKDSWSNSVLYLCNKSQTSLSSPHFLSHHSQELLTCK